MQVRNISAAVITCNNMRSREVSVFRSTRLYFSVSGERYQSESVYFEPEQIVDDRDESIRHVTVPILNSLAQHVRLVLTFELRWILVSEVRFVSGLFQKMN